MRLRPILMTTGAMVLGAVPLALATGAGAESRHQIGWVIVGGMTLGTLLTLFVVPAVYSFPGRAPSGGRTERRRRLPAGGVMRVDAFRDRVQFSRANRNRQVPFPPSCMPTAVMRIRSAVACRICAAA